MSRKRQKTHDATQQTTLANWVSTGGIGLHTGQRVELSLGPAPAGTGIVFERADLSGSPRIPARHDSVLAATYCTIIGKDGARVGTVEHLLGALYGLGIDNAHIVVDGEEVPILDGSAAGWVELILAAGLRRQDQPRRLLKLTREVTVGDAERWLKARPAPELDLRCTVDFDHPLVAGQSLVHLVEPSWFLEEIAPARTFGFLKDVGELRQNGLARGGSLDNAIVVDSYSVLNPGGLRFSDEFVRHKILDLLGDLSLLGGRLLAQVEAYKSGHQLHHRLVQALVTTAGVLRDVTAPSPQPERKRPALEPAQALGS